MSFSPKTKRQNVSVVIPSFNGLNLLKKHLPSVFSNLQKDDELIIVDDASTDETIKWLCKNYSLSKQKDIISLIPDIPLNYDVRFSSNDLEVYTNTKDGIDIILVALQSNKRFAQAVNIGVLFCEYPWFFLLNNDVELLPFTIHRLFEHTGDSVFGIGCLEFEDSKKGEKSGKNKLWFERGMYRHSKADDFKTGKTAWVSGGSGLFNVLKWKSLGGFDHRYYPAYWEDVDISFRARENGWEVLFAEDAVVLHQHESTNTDAFGSSGVDAISWKNGSLFTKTHAKGSQKLSYYLWKPYWMLKRFLAT